MVTLFKSARILLHRMNSGGLRKIIKVSKLGHSQKELTGTNKSGSLFSFLSRTFRTFMILEVFTLGAEMFLIVALGDKALQIAFRP